MIPAILVESALDKGSGLLLKKDGRGLTILLLEILICVSGRDDAQPAIMIMVKMISAILKYDMLFVFIIDLN
jgi:hypothetical protein